MKFTNSTSVKAGQVVVTLLRPTTDLVEIDRAYELGLNRAIKERRRALPLMDSRMVTDAAGRVTHLIMTGMRRVAI